MRSLLFNTVDVLCGLGSFVLGWMLSARLNARTWLGWRVEFWWQVERVAGRAWHRHNDPVMRPGLDWLTGWATKRRYAAENRQRASSARERDGAEERDHGM